MNNLLITVLGHRDSGKSHTWNSLFGRTVRTGTNLRRLYFSDKSYVEVFLVSGSPEERELYVGDILNGSTPPIVLCSMQYTAQVTESFEYFMSQDYNLFVQWLNPGFSDEKEYDDLISLVQFLESKAAVIEKTDGKVEAHLRVKRIHDYLYEWATQNDLLKYD